MALLLSGCCDKARIAQCKAEEAARRELAAVAPAPAADTPEPMRLVIRAGADAKVQARVESVSCVDGRGGSAVVALDWNISSPGVMAVRIRVGPDGGERKVWMDAGAVGQGVTGPWVKDGTVLTIEDLASGASLVELRADAGPCGGEAVE
ncbi:hypothetical protein [Pseudoxanthomonas sp. Soil82]|uniref:hypothetical protein n=1 Tax=Pseudoxanthomonas sp. Soil82 TaxID=3157341 RepID=UPI00338EF3E6